MTDLLKLILGIFTDRFLFVWLSRWFPSILEALAIVRPETIIRWYRSGFRAYWRWRAFDGDCQSGSFLIQRNRDKLSTRKFGVGVFTRTFVSSVTATLSPSLFEVRYS